MTDRTETRSPIRCHSAFVVPWVRGTGVSEPFGFVP